MASFQAIKLEGTCSLCDIQNPKMSAVQSSIHLGPYTIGAKIKKRFWGPILSRQRVLGPSAIKAKIKERVLGPYTTKAKRKGLEHENKHG